MTAILRYWLRAGALSVLLLAQGMMAGSPALAQQRVGVNSAVNPDATGLPPGGAPRRLVLGGEVVLNERIATGSAGQTQIPVCRRLVDDDRAECLHADRPVSL